MSVCEDVMCWDYFEMVAGYNCLFCNSLTAIKFILFVIFAQTMTQTKKIYVFCFKFDF